MKVSPLDRASRGFSLIETVLALSIIAMLLTAVIGLLPAGLATTQKANHTAVEQRILDHLRTRRSAGEFRFDAQGIPINGGEEAAEAFVADVQAAAPATLPGDQAPALPRLEVTLRGQAGTSTRTLVLPPSQGAAGP